MKNTKGNVMRATAAGIAVLAVCLPAAAATKQLTLESSIERALANAVSVRKAENARALSGTQLLQSYGQFLPSLTAAANYAYHSGTSLYTITGLTHVNEADRNATYTLTATLNLFNGAADAAGLSSSVARRQAADLTLRRARQSIALNVAQAYLQAILDRKVVAISERNYAASSGREKLLRTQAGVGSSTLADLYRQIAQARADRSSLIAAETRARDDVLSLLRRLQLDPADDYELVGPDTRLVANAHATQSEARLIEEALGARADLSASERTLEASRSDITVARAGYYPRLDLGFSFQGSGTVLSHQIVNGVSQGPLAQESLLSQLGSQTGYTFGLYLNWSLFDRFVTHLNAERARVAADDAELDSADLRIEVVQETRQALGDYKSSLTQLEAAREGVAAADKAYDIVSGRYSVGASSFIDLLAAQAARVQAEVAGAQAELGAFLLSRQLDFAVGAD